ncbi:Dbl homology domain-containing protein [Absidia repens]|uniref:Dbl homology domain-containing protein n=1 Tax=Absidia repens TaxID=90262 RepID=A0A1X2IX57_9FUNG|nr:Dbl homology domain-containing protein [Absidia repens]
MGQKYQSEPSSPTSYHHHSPMNGSGSTSLPSSTCSLQLSTNHNNDGNSVVYGNSSSPNGGGGNSGKTGRKRLTSFESPLLLPSRARSVLGMKDHQQKEEKAMMAWRTTVTQLDQEEKNQQNNSLSAHRQQQVQWNIPPRMTKKLDAKTELKWLAYRKFIINEIYSTEKSYHELLLLVKKRYMIPMLAASRVKDPLVKFNDIPILFNHLSTLIELSEKILAGFTLERQEEAHHPSTTTVHLASAASSIGYQWLQLHGDWAVFLKYAVHYEVNTKTIKRACNNALLLKIEQESLTRKETNRMGMADYLIAPIQRVPRYCLLLKDLLRHTPTTDADYHYLVKVVNSMIGLARAMNDTQKMHRRKTINI